MLKKALGELVTCVCDPLQKQGVIGPDKGPLWPTSGSARQITRREVELATQMVDRCDEDQAVVVRVQQLIAELATLGQIRLRQAAKQKESEQYTRGQQQLSEAASKPSPITSKPLPLRKRTEHKPPAK